MKRAEALTMSTIVMVIMLLVTLLSVLIFSRYQYGEAAGGIGNLSDETKTAAGGLEMDARDIFCTLKDAGYRYVLCSNGDSDETCCAAPTTFEKYASCDEAHTEGETECRCINCEALS